MPFCVEFVCSPTYWHWFPLGALLSKNMEHRGIGPSVQGVFPGVKKVRKLSLGWYFFERYIFVHYLPFKGCILVPKWYLLKGESPSYSFCIFCIFFSPQDAGIGSSIPINTRFGNGWMFFPRAAVILWGCILFPLISLTFKSDMTSWSEPHEDAPPADIITAQHLNYLMMTELITKENSHY